MVEMHQLERLGAIAWSVLATYSLHAVATVVLAKVVVACLPKARLALATEIWRGSALIALITTAVVLTLHPTGRSIELPLLEQASLSSENAGETLATVEPIAKILPAFSVKAVSYEAIPADTVVGESVVQLSALSAQPIPTKNSDSLRAKANGHDWRWLAGLLLLSLSGLGLLRWSMSIVALRKMIGRCQPTQDSNLLVLLDDLRQRAGITWRIELKISHEVDSPLAIGSDLIVLPRELVDSQDDSLIRAAMAHELAHLLRGDPHWLVFVQMLVYATPWLPTQRWIAAGIHRGMEQLCDDIAARMLGNGLEIAKSLQWVAEHLSHARQQHEVPAMMTHKKHQLVSRVQHLLSDTAGRLALRGGATTWILGAAMATSVIYLCPSFALSADAHEIDDVAPDKVVAAAPVLQDVNTSPAARSAKREESKQARESRRVDAQEERASQREAKRQARHAKRAKQRQERSDARPSHPPAPPKPPRVVVAPPTPPAVPHVEVEPMMPELDAELAKLGQENGEMAAEISREVGEFTVKETAEITKEATALAIQASEVAMLHMELAPEKAAKLSKAQVDALHAKIQRKEAEVARMEKQIEAKAKELEARMQTRSAALEAKLEAKAAKFEEKMKQHAAKLEKAAAQQARAEEKSK